MDHIEQSSLVLIMATALRNNSARDKWPVVTGNISYEETNAQNRKGP